MDTKKAAHLVIERFPGRIPIGYWEQDGVIIVNTRPIKAIRGMTEPGQFAVTKAGDVYGVNPMMYDLSPKKMKKL